MLGSRLGLWLSLFGMFWLPGGTQATEIVGRVTNRTTNQPVAGQEVALLVLRGGMVALDTEDTDGAGRFRFVVAANPNENFLVRVAYQGVNYHQPAILGGGDGIEANVDVYDATGEARDIALESQDFFLEPHANHVRVTELIMFNNRSSPPRTYVPESARNSPLVFRTPGNAGEDVRAVVVGPGGMPLQQQPQPGDEPNTYILDYALRPGTTQIEWSYAVPLVNNRYEFSKRLGGARASPRIVTPLEGIRLTGKSLGAAQEEPSRRVRFYTARLARGNELRFRIEVDPGALAAASSGELPAEEQAAPAGEGSVTLIPNPVSESKWYIVGLTLVVLAFGLYYIYSLSPTGSAADEPKRRPQSHRH